MVEHPPNATGPMPLGTCGDVLGCGSAVAGNTKNDVYLNESGDSVRWHYTNKTWLTPTFIGG